MRKRMGRRSCVQRGFRTVQRRHALQHFQARGDLYHVRAIDVVQQLEHEVEFPMQLRVRVCRGHHLLELLLRLHAHTPHTSEEQPSRAVQDCRARPEHCVS
jgi:hypothetical protein